MIPCAEFILALDSGTSSARAVLYDVEGALVLTHQEPLSLLTPQPGWHAVFAPPVPMAACLVL